MYQIAIEQYGRRIGVIATTERDIDRKALRLASQLVNQGKLCAGAFDYYLLRDEREIDHRIGDTDIVKRCPTCGCDELSEQHNAFRKGAAV